MINARTLLLSTIMATAAILPAALPGTAHAAASAAEINRDSRAALNALYSANPTAKMIGQHAKAVLIFPNVVKAGLVVGGSYGKGELIKGNKVAGYYSTASATWGLQAGAQSYGYALFLMNTDALTYLYQSKGWEIGAGPTVVIVDEGVAKNISTSTLQDDVYAFTFNQQGLMAGITIEGSKITKIKR
jgi:lipid-binding SYLF domain-containing protein